MRFVIKNESDRTEKLKSDQTLIELKDIIINKDKNKISDTVYRDAYNTEDGWRSKVEDQLAISYKNKCAYCERICKADIEHYRPKKAVTGENHEGYYWLCYEWTNLIPACITCNRDGAKHNHFPILGNRVTQPAFLDYGELDLEKHKAVNTPLINERPYLLHPEVDDPNSFFEFKIDSDNKGIRIKGIDQDGRGEKTIKICKLNRQELKIDRLRVINEVVNGIRGVFGMRAIGGIDDRIFLNLLINNLQNSETIAKNTENTHTLLRKYIITSTENFEQIVLPFLLVKERNIVLEAFKLFKETNQLITENELVTNE